MKQFIIWTFALFLVIDLAIAVQIVDPKNSSIVERTGITDDVTISFYMDYHANNCWYARYSSINTKGTELPIADCKLGMNEINFPVAYFGKHQVIIYTNTSGVIQSDTVNYEVKYKESSTVKKETQTPLLISETEDMKTCGIDADGDGVLCDANEDLVSCSADCKGFNFDSLICLKKQECLWTQAWFLKTAFFLLLIGVMVMLFNEHK